MVFFIINHRPSNKDIQQTHPCVKQIVVPICLRAEILQSYHDGQTPTHNGIELFIMYATLREKYYWPTMYAEVRTYCKSCMSCQRAKRDYHAQKPPLQPIAPVDLFHKFVIDILGPLPPSKGDPKGHQYILLCVESLSRWPEIITLPDQSADTVADALFNHVFSRYGAPAVIQSDRASNFCSALVTRLCTHFAIKRTKSSSFHPQTNSAAERFNSVILNSLRCYIDKQDDWLQYIPAILMGYRSTVAIASTGHSPFYILYGRNMKLPIDNQILPLPSTGVRTADEYIQKMLPKLQLAREVAQENVRSHQAQSKNRYDTNIRVVAYKPGDKCWLYDPKTPKGKSKNLILRWHGPYFVLRQTGISNYMLADWKTKKAIPYAVNVERMKPFNDT